MTFIYKGTTQVLSEHFSPAREFYEHQCRLLITGGEGCGKTIQLLNFVDDLIPRGAVGRRSLPVVLNLASWVNKPGGSPLEQQGIREWLDAQFKDQYGLVKNLSKPLIDSDRLIYCLDGYDEIGGTRDEKLEGDDLDRYESKRSMLRKRFWELFLDFITHGDGKNAKGLIISCQTSSSAELAVPGRPFVELKIGALNIESVMEYLDLKGFRALRALSTRADVLDQLTIPLQLQIFSAVYNPSRHDALREDGIAELLDEAKTNYYAIEDFTYKSYFAWKIHNFEALDNNINKKGEAAKHRHDEHGWDSPLGLTFNEIDRFTHAVASYLDNRSFRTFQLDRLQPYELPFKLRGPYLTVNSLLFAVTVFLVAGIPVGLAVTAEYWAMGYGLTGIQSGLLAAAGVGILGGGLVALGYRFLRAAWLGAVIGLAFAVGRAIAVGLSGQVPGSTAGMSAAQLHGVASLLAVPVFEWVLSKVKEEPLVIVPVETWETDRRNAIIAVGIALLFGIGFGILLGPARGISFGVALALAMASRFGKREVTIPIRVRPNQAIEFSKREALKHALGITCISVVVFGLAYGYSYGYKEGINNAILALAFLLVFFFFGGIPVLKHYAMRIALTRARLLPRRAVQFLEMASRAGLLRQVGGGFQFSHTKVQAYFARQGHKETWGTGQNPVPPYS